MQNRLCKVYHSSSSPGSILNAHRGLMTIETLLNYDPSSLMSKKEKDSIDLPMSDCEISS
jgi:hypothetical protein